MQWVNEQACARACVCKHAESTAAAPCCKAFAPDSTATPTDTEALSCLVQVGPVGKLAEDLLLLDRRAAVYAALPVARQGSWLCAALQSVWAPQGECRTRRPAS
jgi:hypothetical protein